ncbi:lysylphosphatidylglycerol synthase transmembrane domain-containing protein [Marinobacter fonticola]|uniref:lysylphosphatidylglycerol synthase transmembrane domain-containing protein n=1 Tax=Marinobacter fonticola TaxID=2603215 RepID=UPI0011E62CD4|nr:lysylphosphatidylglycerol synthase transmembrane domain-containing protein [Marinobacter fonticola]
MSRFPPSRLKWPLLKWLWTLAILAGAVFAFGQTDLVSRLANLSLTAVALALALFTVQVGLSAWRWRFTARQLGLSIDGVNAVREYYLATFINQVLPGGVLGDANRALRHGKSTQRPTEAIHAVMIERLSGQIVLALLAGAVWFMTPVTSPESPLVWEIGGVGSTALIIGVLIVLTLVALLFRARLRAFAGAFRHALWVGLIKPRVLIVHLVSSVIVVGSYVLAFVVLGWGMEAAMPLSVLVPCVLCLLLVMAIPVTVAGWGIREGVAGALWLWAGYPAEEGLALSIAYGTLFMISSLPGALFLALSLIPRFQGLAKRMSNR